MAYQPRADGVAGQVVCWLQLHAGGRLDVDGIVELCQLKSGSSVHTLMALALDADLVKRTRDEDGTYWYSAGRAMPDATVTPTKPGKPRRRRVVADTLEICDDPFPDSSSTRQSALWAKFDALEVGQCIKCEPAEVMSLSHSMKRWLQARGRTGLVVRRMKQYPDDGGGRVWLMADPAAPVGAKAAKR